MSASTIWITGASGFTGTHLVKYIRSLPLDAHIVSLSNVAEIVPDVDESINCDITDAHTVKMLAEKYPPNGVFHLAGMMPPNDDAIMFNVNVAGTYTLINSLHMAGCKNVRVLSIGSAAEYFANATGEYTEESVVGGFSPYGGSKCAQTLLALKAGEAMGVDVIVARTFNLIGPGLSRNLVIGEICAQIAEGKTTLNLGNIDSERDFLDVRDAVRAYWCLFQQGTNNSIYNVATGVSTSIREVIELAAKIAGTELNILTDTSKLKSQDLDRSCGNIDKICSEIDWAPEIPIERSIRDMMKG